MATKRIFYAFLLLSWVSISLAADDPAHDPDTTLGRPHKLTDLQRCDWLVTYRNRTYDLAPLSHGSLDRPLEGDIRSILRRVPKAGEHLDKVDQLSKRSTLHSIISSAGITTFVLTRLIRNEPSITRNGKLATVDLVGIAGLVLFAKSALDAHRTNDEAKTETALAVDAFNADSPNKIEPVKEEPHAETQ